MDQLEDMRTLKDDADPDVGIWSLKDLSLQVQEHLDALQESMQKTKVPSPDVKQEGDGQKSAGAFRGSSRASRGCPSRT